MKKYIRPLGALIAISLSVAVGASEPEFTYVEGGYTEVHLDGVGGDPDGYYINGSLALTDSMFVTAGYQDLSARVRQVDVDVSLLSLGAGFNAPIGNNAAWYLSGELLRHEVDISGAGSDNDNGYGINAGLRAYISGRLEGLAEVSYADIGSADGVSGTLGGIFHLSNSLGFTLKGTVNDDSDTAYSVGVRLTF